MPIESKENVYKPAKFDVLVNNEIFVDKEYVHSSMDDESSILINALTENLHRGHNPRYGRPGRIPKSINIPFSTFIENDSFKLKSLNGIRRIISDNALDKNKTIVNYCGGGISATLDSFVLYQLGFNDLKIYDNSMSEWSKDENLPIETD